MNTEDRKLLEYEYDIACALHHLWNSPSSVDFDLDEVSIFFSVLIDRRINLAIKENVVRAYLKLASSKDMNGCIKVTIKILTHAEKIRN
jgi:hypothetical protein